MKFDEKIIIYLFIIILRNGEIKRRVLALMTAWSVGSDELFLAMHEHDCNSKSSYFAQPLEKRATSAAAPFRGFGCWRWGRGFFLELLLLGLPFSNPNWRKWVETGRNSAAIAIQTCSRS